MLMRFSNRLGLLVVYGATCAFIGAASVYLLNSRERYALSGSAAPMTVETTLEKKHSCSTLSPAMKMGGIPADAVRLHVEIIDLNYLYNHGGGIVLPTKSGLITEGALSHYYGPCPGGENHTYRIRVNALNKVNKVIGIAEMTMACCTGM